MLSSSDVRAELLNIAELLLAPVRAVPCMPCILTGNNCTSICDGHVASDICPSEMASYGHTSPAIDNSDCVVQDRFNALSSDRLGGSQEDCYNSLFLNPQAVDIVYGHRCRNKKSNCSNSSKFIK